MELAPSSIGSSERNKTLAALIDRVAGGEQHAMTMLYDMTNRLVYGLALRILNDAGAAEEVMLDVYTQVWRQASRYDDRRGGPLAWLTTITRSRAIDRLRSGAQDENRREPLEMAGQQAVPSSVDHDVAMLEMRKIVGAALDALAPEQREVIELAYYGGFSQTEIAARLGQPLGTVKTRARLGMMKLREYLAPALAEGLI